MNIHIDDSVLIRSLIDATMTKSVIGSRMYGTNNPNSDIDFLYIYATSEKELLSPVRVHHQLQCKVNNIDYNFTSLHNFIYNILNGDSTINFELIHSKLLIGTQLEFLHEMKDDFISYQLIRSYLGLCRRDIKHFHKSTTEYDKRKKLGHIIRGYMYANAMIEHVFNFDELNNEFREILLNVDVSNNTQLRHYEKLVSKARETLNERFGDGTLGYPQYMTFDNLKKLENYLFDFCKSDYFLTKQNNLSNFDNSHFLNSFENWVDYNNK